VTPASRILLPPERLDACAGHEEIRLYIAATAEERRELLQDEKHLAVVSSRLAIWLDVRISAIVITQIARS
jgi:hypothetical protein